MGRIRVPSIQHAAGIWSPEPAQIAKRLLQLAESSPPFSYGNLHKLTFDLISRSAPYEQVHAAAQAVRPALARKNYLEILPLLKSYGDRAAANVVTEIVPRHYSIGRDLRTLVNPPLAYYKGGRGHLPWFVFWKANHFNKSRLELFVSMLRDVFRQDPDFDEAFLSLVICSEQRIGAGRQLTVLDASTVSELPSAERNEMLRIFAEGYSQAAQAKAEGRHSESKRKEMDNRDDDQFDLFA